MALHNWRLYLNEDGLWIVSATPMDAGDRPLANPMLVNKGRGSESGRRITRFENDYGVRRDRVFSAKWDDSILMVEIASGLHQAKWSHRYQNGKFPHHRAPADVSELIRKARVLKFVS